MIGKARIAHLARPNATIQNTPPLVTSNKARAKHNLAPPINPDANPAQFDVLRVQRLPAPVTVYVEQFSAHPLEADAAELYGPPDGYIDTAGHVHKERAERHRREGPRVSGRLRHSLSCRAGARGPAYLGRVQDGNNSSGSLTQTNGMPC
jgi:hypothetical protein